MAIKVFDTFVGANGTQITAHTPDTDVVGTGWEVFWGSTTLNGDGSIQVNTAAGDGGLIDAGIVDTLVTVNGDGSAVDGFSACSRATSTTDYYEWEGGRALMSKRVGNVYTILSNGTNPASETVDEGKLITRGSSLEGSYNGVSLGSVTDASHTTATKVAFMGNGTATYGAIIDVFDFTAEDAPPVISSALTGTVTGTITETDIQAGGKTIILTLTNDTFVAAGATFDATRQAFIDGLTD